MTEVKGLIEIRVPNLAFWFCHDHWSSGTHIISKLVLVGPVTWTLGC